MSFYNLDKLRVGVCIDDGLSGVKKGEFVFYYAEDYNSNWPTNINIITEFAGRVYRDRHLEPSPLNNILDIDLAFKNLSVPHIYVLSKLLERGKSLVKMLEDRRSDRPVNLRSEHFNSPLLINSDFLEKQLKLANDFGGSFPYSNNVWKREIFESYKCTAVYVYAVKSDKDLEPTIYPVTARKADLFSTRRSTAYLNSLYGLRPFGPKAQAMEYLQWKGALENNTVSMNEESKRHFHKYFGKTFDCVISDENALDIIKKEENYMRHFLQNIEYMEVSAKRSILEVKNRIKSYAIYYPEMEITDSIADELIFILIDMYNNRTNHKVIFNPEKGTTTVELGGYFATVKCHGDDKFSFSKGYLAALAKASRHGKMNWLSEIKNHRKVHILPKKEESNTLPWEEIPNMKTYPTLEGDDD